MLTPVTANEQVEELLRGPGPAWVFKHSATCGISQAAHEQVETYASRHPEQRIGLVVVQTHRPLSNWVAAKLGVTHQSPQLFLIKDGRVAWQASHWSITSDAMEKAAEGP
jgi:bacillithiol system protein YtxJ